MDVVFVLGLAFAAIAFVTVARHSGTIGLATISSLAGCFAAAVFFVCSPR